MVIEKIFSEINGEERIYSVVMTEEEIALFSEHEAKLKFRDRLGVYGYKNLNNQSGRDKARETWKTGKTGKQQRMNLMAGLAGSNMAQSFGKSLEHKVSTKDALIGAGISAGLGVGEGYLLSKAVDYHRTNRLKKNPKVYEKEIDRINVAEGKMSKEEFAKKYYK